MDHDTYSAGSLIGSVTIDLNTMIMRSNDVDSQGVIFEGWMPIYDTLEGIRGELYVQISLDVIGDKNVGMGSTGHDEQSEEGSPGIFIFASNAPDANQYRVRDSRIPHCAGVEHPRFRGRFNCGGRPRIRVRGPLPLLPEE